MPLNYFLKNKSKIYVKWGVGDDTIDKWSFWKFQMNINLINEIQQQSSNTTSLANTKL